MSSQRPDFRSTLLGRMAGYEKRLAEKVTRGRMKLGLEVDEIARKADISPRTWERWRALKQSRSRSSRSSGRRPR